MLFELIGGAAKEEWLLLPYYEKLEKQTWLSRTNACKNILTGG